MANLHAFEIEIAFSAPPEQKLSVAETIEAYTMGSAYAKFQENEKDSITPVNWPTWSFLAQHILNCA